MITVSLCMIVKNESEEIARCLDSVKDIVDEIIVVDTGSTDNTEEIVRVYTDKVYAFQWDDDFAAARNFSFRQATMDYIFWLDADDVLLPEEREKLTQLKMSLSPEVDAVSMQYHCDFDEYGNCTLNVRRTRLVKRLKGYLWEGCVHEDLCLSRGNFLESDVAVTHRKQFGTSHPDRNLRIYERMLAEGRQFSIRDTLHYAMELHQHRFYEKAVENYLKFVNSNNLTNEDRIHACTKLADCYYYLGDRQKEREFTLRTFEYDVPRPESCCRLGYYFLEQNQFEQAAFWYQLALQSPPSTNHWAISNQVSRTWLPHMQLGLCYYQLGEYELSYRHNTIALDYLPNNPGILNNVHLLRALIADNVPSLPSSRG